MATVTKGRTFVSGETVTPAKLNELVDSATVTNIVNADISASADIAGSKLADSAVTTAKINNAAVTAAKLDGAQTGSAPIYGCRAWVNFNGTSVTDVGGEDRCAIRASGNVSKVVRNGTGDYTITFATAMPDANYCALVVDQTSADNINDPNGGAVIARTSTAYQTDSIRVRTMHNTMTTYHNATAVNVAIFR